MGAIKTRQSNIELLRIISIFLILVVHADFVILGAPSSDDILLNPLGSISKIFWEMISIICVNIFVFISGWFSIRFSVKGICKLIFQILFLQAVIYITAFITGHESPGIGTIFGLFMFDKYFWFVKAYIGLIILSPLINSFVSHSSRKTISVVLIAYYIFQTIYAWMTDGAWFLNSGYCITSLSAIYLLARYIRISYNQYLIGDNSFKFLKRIRSKYIYLATYLLIAIANTILYLISFKIPGGGYLRERLTYYSNPFVILQSICLFMFFLNIKLDTSKIINWIAASSFAVFIVHVTDGMKFYRLIIEAIYSNWSGWSCLVILFLSMLAIFALSIVLDYPRKLLWQWINQFIPDYKCTDSTNS